MTKEEKIERLRRKKLAARRKRMRFRRRAYTLLLVCVIVLIAIVFFNAGKKSANDTVSNNAIPTAGAGSVGATGNSFNGANSQNDEYTGLGNVEKTAATGYQNPNQSYRMDVSTGNANINLLEIEENGGDAVAQAKNAMQNTAFFNGVNNSVNNVLLSYAPDGVWHAIKTTDGDICAFFTGHHEGDSFRVTFNLLNDGTFYLQDVRINDENISEPVVFIAQLL